MRKAADQRSLYAGTATDGVAGHKLGHVPCPGSHGVQWLIHKGAGADGRRTPCTRRRRYSGPSGHGRCGGPCGAISLGLRGCPAPPSRWGTICRSSWYFNSGTRCRRRHLGGRPLRRIGQADVFAVQEPHREKRIRRKPRGTDSQQLSVFVCLITKHRSVQQIRLTVPT